MSNSKVNVNIEIDADIKELAPTLDEQISSAVLQRTQKMAELTLYKDGNILVDKKLHPEVYDWAVNG